MAIYTTAHVMNLSTGAPLTLEVPPKILTRFEQRKALFDAREIQKFLEENEFTLFPSYQELLKINFDNGFTIELITQILTDFGIQETFIEKLIEDEEYIANTRGRFEDITRDGERAARTLRTVYGVTKKYFSATESVERIDFPTYGEDA